MILNYNYSDFICSFRDVSILIFFHFSHNYYFYDFLYFFYDIFKSAAPSCIPEVSDLSLS